MPPSGVDYASEFLNGYAPEYVLILKQMNRNLIIIVGIFIAIIVTLLTGNIIIIGDKIGRLTHVYVE